MKLDLSSKAERTTITIQPAYLNQLKELSIKTRLRMSDLYTLALHELLDKYDVNDGEN
ncbi:ribbon-helix-helix domain-containing protein [Bacillus tuaregi]|uniref:ribbon-helix-helix domain-containing protein n=1 Tax=Bacillus tuaregi TaxID=1816695 RepID=UPI0009FFA2CD